MSPYRQSADVSPSRFAEWLGKEGNRKALLEIAGVKPPDGWHQDLVLAAATDAVVYRLLSIEERDPRQVKVTIPVEKLGPQFAGAAVRLRELVHDAIVFAGSVP